MNNITLETNPVIFIMMQYHDYFNQMKIQYAIKILFIYFNSFLRIASFYSIPLISHSIENLPPHPYPSRFYCIIIYFDIRI